MHGSSFDRPSKPDKIIYGNSGIGFLAIPAFLAIAVVALAIARPAVSSWISEAAQAEFAGANGVPEADPAQLAQPATKIHAAKAN